MVDGLIITVNDEYTGQRIDKLISALYDSMSRSAIQKILDEGNVTVNGIIVTKNYKVRPNDKISVVIPKPKDLQVTAENIPLDIRYEDDDLLVVNKPKGMVVHPAAGNYDGTLVNALLYHCKDSLSGINGVIRPGIVHRIDKDTSGLLLLTADGEFAHRVISPKSCVEKRYYARVEGEATQEDVNAFEKGIVLADGTKCLPAKLELLGDGCVAVTVMEGKYHQVRRMLASRGKPVLELRRLSIGELILGDELGSGNYRELDEDDLCRVLGGNLRGK